MLKILLIGEYSNVHNTLAQGMRTLGHEVVVASDGDGWKDYPRQIDLARNHDNGIRGKVDFALKLAKALPKLRGFDVVQVVNPIFLDATPRLNRLVFDYLRRWNKKVVMGAYGIDYYWVKTCLEQKAFRYSDFYAYGKKVANPLNEDYIAEWINGERGRLSQYVAEKCDGIAACLYEYEVSYRDYFKDKLVYIPLPIDLEKIKVKHIDQQIDKVNFFIGIQKLRSASKGTDIIYDVLKEVCAKYPEQTQLTKVESVPYDEYVRLMGESHVVIDQLYSYTPAMNALMAMAQGKVVGSGAEPEMYEHLGESELRPIINLIPDREKLFETIEKVVLEKDRLPLLSKQSREFVEKYHDHIKVAAQYLEFYEGL